MTTRKASATAKAKAEAQAHFYGNKKSKAGK
jgi:hypothetical protein